MDQDLINRIVEGALLAANQPLTLAQLHALFPEDQPAPNDSVEQALEFLREDCANRGVELVELASGFRYQVKADVHGWVSRLWTERKTKYTRATLETLALIAYRQPITRGEIEQVRGVAVSSNIIQALEEREWIRVVGHRDVPGKPALFGTTKAFLDYFGLKRLDELPPLSELKDIGELEPQLQFDNVIDPTPIEAGGLGVEPGVEAEAANTDEADDNSANDNDADNDDLSTDESEDNQIEGIADANDETTDSASNGEPETAQGDSAEDENDFLRDEYEEAAQDNAVETTTVPTDDDALEASSEQEKND
ncbi:SMC-Scp complex subunit ScpB [Lysobacter tyrosinilyticus]